LWNENIRDEFLQKVFEREARFVRELGVDTMTGLTVDGW
jgi:hypothetical protein